MPVHLTHEATNPIAVNATLADSHETLTIGGAFIDFTGLTATKNGVDLAFTAQEFKLLRYFARSPNRVISRIELLDRVWGYERYPTTRTVDEHVFRLRQKIEPTPRRPRYFVTSYRLGYRFVPNGRFRR